MIYEKLIEVQKALKAPKNQRNAFGGYNYRSCEDILEAVKPLLAKAGLLLTISDEIVNIGAENGETRFYVKATATIHSTDGNVSVSAYAREDLERKGFDGAQLTGSSSSYARKYALCGLLCLDDTKDSDFTNTHGKDPVETAVKTPAPRSGDFIPTCKACGKEISRAEHDYSVSKYGAPYCRACQKKATAK